VPEQVRKVKGIRTGYKSGSRPQGSKEQRDMTLCSNVNMREDRTALTPLCAVFKVERTVEEKGKERSKR